MVLTQGQIKHFVKRLEDEKAKKIALVNKAYPVTDVKYPKMLKDGKGKLKTDKEIRAILTSKNRAYDHDHIYIWELYDFTKDVTGIEKTNEANKQTREDHYMLINEQIEKLTDEAYIGDAGALLGMLENFRKMTFGVKA